MSILRSLLFGGFASVVAFGTATPTGAAVSDIDSMVPALRSPLNAYPDSNLTFTDNLSSTGTVSFHEDNFGMPDLGAGFFANQHKAWFSSDGGATAHPFLNQESFRISLDLNLDTNATSPRKEAGIIFSHPATGTGWLIVTSENGEIATFGSFLPYTSNLINDGDGVEYGGIPYTPGTDVSVEVVYRPGIGSILNGDMVTPASLEFIVNGFSSGVRALGNLENGFLDGTEAALYFQSQVDVAAANSTSVSATFKNITIVPEPASLALLCVSAVTMLHRRRV